MESSSRSLLKTVSWRITATLITGIISWLVTGNYSFAITIGVTDSLVKLLGYYLHERVWNHIEFGRDN